MIRKTLYLSLLFLCVHAMAEAQEALLPTDASLLTLGIGIPINTHRDKAHSAMAYSGTGIRFYVRTEDYGRNSLFRFQLSVDNIGLRSRLRPKRDLERSASLNNVQLSWGYYRRIGGKLSADDQQYLGLSYNLQFNNRRYSLPTNNINGFLVQNNFAVSAIDRRRIGDGKWSVTSHLDVPVFSGVYRPTYIGLAPRFYRSKSGTFTDMVRHTEWGFWQLFSKVRVGADFNHQIRDWRANRYGLEWDVFHVNRPKEKSFISTTGSLLYGFNVLL